MIRVSIYARGMIRALVVFVSEQRFQAAHQVVAHFLARRLAAPHLPFAQHAAAIQADGAQLLPAGHLVERALVVHKAAHSPLWRLERRRMGTEQDFFAAHETGHPWT